MYNHSVDCVAYLFTPWIILKYVTCKMTATKCTIGRFNLIYTAVAYAVSIAQKAHIIPEDLAILHDNYVC